MMPVRMILGALSLLAVPLAGEAGDLTIELKVNGQPAAEIRLQFKDGMAVSTVAGEAEQFNLREMSWLDAVSNRWVTLAQCEAWALQAKARTMKSIDLAPAQMRSFILWSLNPIFTVEKSNDVLRLTSGQVDYLIERVASQSETEGYYRYAVLNAYKKAMTERKLPPFAELKVIAEMKALGHIPAAMAVSIPGIPEAPGFTLDITENP